MKTLNLIHVGMVSLLTCSFADEQPKEEVDEQVDSAGAARLADKDVRLPWEAAAIAGQISCMILGSAELVQDEGIIISHQKDGKTIKYSKFRIKARKVIYWSPVFVFDPPREIEAYAALLGEGGGFELEELKGKEQLFLLKLPNVGSIGRFHIAFSLSPSEGPRLLRSLGWREETTKSDFEQ
jgi:hypothetical protein